jgi:hypothetical protein
MNESQDSTVEEKGSRVVFSVSILDKTEEGEEIKHNFNKTVNLARDYKNKKRKLSEVSKKNYAYRIAITSSAIELKIDKYTYI